MKTFFSLVLLVAATLAQAAPTISGFTGTLSNGQTINVNGGSMMNHDTTNWDSATTLSKGSFEGTNITADGFTGSPSPGYSTDRKVHGAKAMKLSDSGLHSSNGSNAFQVITAESLSGTSWTDVYFGYYVQYNANKYADNYWKQLWAANGAEYAFFQPCMSESVGNYATPTQWCILASGYNGAGSWLKGNIPGGAIQNNRWYYIEGHYRIHGAGSYVLQVWVDGVQVINQTSGVTAGVSPNPGGWGREFNTNYCCTPSDWVADLWFDRLVFSQTRVRMSTRFELSDTTDCSDSNSSKVLQAPVTLGDSSAAFTYNKGSLTTGRYLCVTDNRNQASAAFDLTGGAPAPTRLRVRISANDANWDARDYQLREAA